MYKLEFLPVAQRDMVEIVQYISRELSNPTAAERLAEELISAAYGRSRMPIPTISRCDRSRMNIGSCRYKII